MGVDVHHIVMLGASVEGEFDYEENEDLIGRKTDLGKIQVVYDGMSGEYCYVGVILASSAGQRYESGAFETPIDISFKLLYDIQTFLMSSETFKRLAGSLASPHLIVFSHYT